MEEELKLISRLQKKAAHDVVIQQYDDLVKHVKAIHILPHLVSSKLVEPDFHQYLDGERTERGKMMVDTATKCYLHATYSSLASLAS